MSNIIINHKSAKVAQDDYFDWVCHFLEDAAYGIWSSYDNDMRGILALGTEDCSVRDMEGLV